MSRPTGVSFAIRNLLSPARLASPHLPLASRNVCIRSLSTHRPPPQQPQQQQQRPQGVVRPVGMAPPNPSAPTSSQPQPGNGTPQPTVEVNEQTFVQEVMQGSKQGPIILDCYADWCKPCKILRPVLESEVNAHGGVFRLATLNIDTNPNLAQALQVTQLPTVVAIFQGKVVDAFVGSLPAHEISKWLARVSDKLGISQAKPSDTPESVLAVGEGMLSNQRFAQAGTIFRGLLANPQVPESVLAPAKAGAALCSVAEGRFAEAKALVADIEQSHKTSLKQPLVLQAVAMIKLVPETALDHNELASRVASNPEDLDAQLDFARSLLFKGDVQQAVDVALAVIGKNKNWRDGAARTQVVTMFAALGDKHPATVQGRKRLSNLLFH